MLEFLFEYWYYYFYGCVPAGVVSCYFGLSRIVYSYRRCDKDSLKSEIKFSIQATLITTIIWPLFVGILMFEIYLDFKERSGLNSPVLKDKLKSEPPAKVVEQTINKEVLAVIDTILHADESTQQPNVKKKRRKRKKKKRR